MERSELKAIVMALIGPRGTTMMLNEQNFKFMSDNADRILEICEVKEKKSPKK